MYKGLMPFEQFREANNKPPRIITTLNQEEKNMNVIFKDDATVLIRFAVNDIVTMKKQEIADYLLGKYDDGMVFYNSIINERQLLMSYLPFIHTIVINDYSNERKLEENEIKLIFERSSLANPSPITIGVSQELHDFLSKR